MDEQSIKLFDFFSQHARQRRVDLMTKLRLRLRLIYGSVSCGINDDRWTNLSNQFPHRCHISQIHIRTPHCHDIANWSQRALQLPSNLAALSD